MAKTSTSDHPDLKFINPAAAAIDIGLTMHMAAMNLGSAETSVRAFGTFTSDPHGLEARLQSCGEQAGLAAGRRHIDLVSSVVPSSADPTPLSTDAVYRAGTTIIQLHHEARRAAQIPPSAVQGSGEHLALLLCGMLIFASGGLSGIF